MTNELQRILIILAIVLFVFTGVATLFFLFGGFFISEPSVAVIDLRGEITSSDLLLDKSVSASVMRQMFKDAADDPSIVAVVLRINSGGGGVVETKEIARSLSLLDEKPVVAYISDVGASGAYYVASFADAIVSDEDSLIGSIGVISTFMVYKDLLEEKLGINTTVIKSGDFKDIGSPYREMTDKEKDRLQEIVDTIHQEFLDVIILNRGLSPEAVNEIESSTIFLGSEALKLGLVDHTGGFEDALALAADMADYPNASVYYMDDSDYYETDFYYSLGRGVGDSLASKLDVSSPLELT